MCGVVEEAIPLKDAETLRQHEEPQMRVAERFQHEVVTVSPGADTARAGRIATAMKVVAAEFDWRDDHPPRHSWANTVIYEVHVRGFTAHASSGVEFPGTYRGLIEKIPYLKELGVTAVELLPVQEFNAHERWGCDPGKPRSPVNYWGYDPVGFSAPNGAYSSAGDSGQQVAEFKEMVRELHAAGIEVILDIVLDHAAESGERGSRVVLGRDRQSCVDCTATLGRGHARRRLPPRSRGGSRT